MTAWQDLPPRTRRQARLDERPESASEGERSPEEADHTSDFSPATGYSADRHELTSAYSRRSRRVADVPDNANDFRIRDFRPASVEGAEPETDDSGRLTYRTQARPAASSPISSPPLVDAVPAQFAAPPRPMTRRELRELESRQGTRPQANDGPEPVVAAPSAQPASPAQPAVPSQSAVPAPAEEAPAALVSPEPVIFTDASGAPPMRAPIVPTPVSRGIDHAPQVFPPPDAHWQTQAQIDVVNLGEGDFPRANGSNAALTTNALVIPSIPQASDIIKPVSSTGEILITGSIDLPTALGSTGANPSRYDHADIDALFAQEDHDYAPTDAAPVRAIRAVSTHTSTHGVISAKKPANNRLPMMMAVTAGILAVGVAALFAAGMIFGYF